MSNESIKTKKTKTAKSKKEGVKVKSSAPPISFSTKKKYVKQLKTHMKEAQVEVLSMMNEAYGRITKAIYDEQKSGFFDEFLGYKRLAVERGFCNGSILEVILQNVLSNDQIEEKIVFFETKAKSGRAGLTKQNKAKIVKQEKKRQTLLGKTTTKTKYMQLYTLCQKIKKARKANNKTKKDEKDADKMILTLLAFEPLFKSLNISAKDTVSAADAISTLPQKNPHASESLNYLLDLEFAGENLVFYNQVGEMKKLGDNDYIIQFLILYQTMIHHEIQSEIKINISSDLCTKKLRNLFVWARDHYVIGLGVEDDEKDIKCKIEKFPYVARLEYAY